MCTQEITILSPLALPADLRLLAVKCPPLPSSWLQLICIGISLPQEPCFNPCKDHGLLVFKSRLITLSPWGWWARSPDLKDSRDSGNCGWFADEGPQVLSFQSWHQPVEWPWATHCTSLMLSFLFDFFCLFVYLFNLSYAGSLSLAPCVLLKTVKIVLGRLLTLSQPPPTLGRLQCLTDVCGHFSRNILAAHQSPWVSADRKALGQSQPSRSTMGLYVRFTAWRHR